MVAVFTLTRMPTQPSSDQPFSWPRSFSPCWQSAVNPGRHDSNVGQLNVEDHIVMPDCNMFKKLQRKCTLEDVDRLVPGTSMPEDAITL